MHRLAPQIKKDMLEWLKKNLHIRSSDEWGYDTFEADPLVHLMIGACASEAQVIHQAIVETEERLQKRLLSYLLPEAFHCPQPAFGVIKVQPSISTCHLSSTQVFEVKTSKENLFFTPAFETTLVNGKVRFLCSNLKIIDLNAPQSFQIDDKTESVKDLLVGIETKEKIDNLENFSFYFDWQGSLLEKQVFLLALSNSQWIWNGQILNRQLGFITDQVSWSDQFNAQKDMFEQINAQYKLHFHLIKNCKKNIHLEVAPQDVLMAWLNEQLESPDKDRVNEEWADIKGNFIWLRITLPYSISLKDLQRNLVIGLNHFPVINRYLIQKADSDTYFSKSLGWEVFPILPPRGTFLSIQAIKNRLTGEDIQPFQFAQLLKQKSDQPVYSLRYGGTGRLDTYNAWERLAYMLSIFRGEQREREMVEKLGTKLSLEELHEAIGQRLKSNFNAEVDNATTTPYVFIKLNAQQQLDVEANYWVTEGEAANNIPPGTALVGTPPVAGLDQTQIKFVTTTRGGKTRLSEAEQTQALQDTLVRRGRVVSPNDVKSVCRRIMGEYLQEVQIKPFFETNFNLDEGVRRALEVSIKVTNPEDPYLWQLGQEIEWTLQENSVGTLPYRVNIC